MTEKEPVTLLPGCCPDFYRAAEETNRSECAPPVILGEAAAVPDVVETAIRSGRTRAVVDAHADGR
ncbi:hypothetical protein [Streptomyces sp. NBC_00391]|uniref:hypothetical protein n=1 Tax=Streptomyces sp. NBC_00391 TaxID=2903647 RepID=UPI002E2240AE